MTYIMFGVGWEVRYNMRDFALQKIDYFVDNDSKWWGQTFLGKEIKSPETLRGEDKGNTIVIVGSVSHRAVITYQLEEMGFTEGENLFWAPNWHGNQDISPFYYRENRWPYLFEKNRALLDSWYFKGRAEIISHLIDWEHCNSVMDLGAGAMLIQKYLRPGVRYFPVDFIPYAPETISCRLDEYEFPALATEHIDYAILSGTLELVRDWKWLLRETAQVARNLIISIVTMEIMPEIKARADHGFVTQIYAHELILYMQEIGYKMTQAKERQRLDNIYVFERL